MRSKDGTPDMCRISHVLGVTVGELAGDWKLREQKKKTIEQV